LGNSVAVFGKLCGELFGVGMLLLAELQEHVGLEPFRQVAAKLHGTGDDKAEASAVHLTATLLDHVEKNSVIQMLLNEVWMAGIVDTEVDAERYLLLGVFANLLLLIKSVGGEETSLLVGQDLLLDYAESGGFIQVMDGVEIIVVLEDVRSPTALKCCMSVNVERHERVRNALDRK